MKREDLSGSPFVGVISARRHANVKGMIALVGDATWYVTEEDAPLYLAEGAASVVVGGSLCASRNRLLQDAFDVGASCVQLSDDLKALKAGRVVDGEKVAVDIGFGEAIRMLSEALDMTGAKLAGAAPTANPFYWNPSRTVHTQAFVVGDLMLVRPSAVRFDERLRLKEDYDFTLQHIHRYDCVARRDDLFATFLHRKNAGGAVSYRTTEAEQDAIRFLKASWPGYVRDNPRRPNEILLSFPKPKSKRK